MKSEEVLNKHVIRQLRKKRVYKLGNEDDNKSET